MLTYIFIIFSCLMRCSCLQETKVLTPRQSKYKKFLNSECINLIVSLGPAGTGKTWIACKHAIEQLQNNKVKKIIITRPIVTLEGEDIGFLPGDINDKFSPFTNHIYEYFKNEFSQREIDSLIRQNLIEATPIGFLRGRTFDDTFIIADEMQNSSPKQLLMLLTRLGENSKIVIAGDLTQCDLSEEKQEENGLKNLVDNLQYHYESFHRMLNDNIVIIEFDIHDCKRSPFVKKIIDIYSKNNSKIM